MIRRADYYLILTSCSFLPSSCEAISILPVTLKLRALPSVFGAADLTVASFCFLVRSPTLEPICCILISRSPTFLSRPWVRSLKLYSWMVELASNFPRAYRCSFPSSTWQSSLFFSFVSVSFSSRSYLSSFEIEFYKSLDEAFCWSSNSNEANFSVVS